MESDNDMHCKHLNDLACPLMCQVVVVVVRVQQWLEAVEQWFMEMVVGGNDTVKGDGEDLMHQMRGKGLGGESVEFEHKSKFSKFGCSIHEKLL